MARRDPDRHRKTVIVTAAFVVLVLLAVSTFLAFVAGARLEPATFGLIFAAATLLYALYTLFRVAQALARPSARILADAAELAARSSHAEQREERKRVLKAIKELDFDHAMGKISADDHRAVRERYQTRAVEVMRLLEDSPSLHPDLLALLAVRGARAGALEAEPGVPVIAYPEPTMAACLPCGGANDPDARFCKQCGSRL